MQQIIFSQVKKFPYKRTFSVNQEFLVYKGLIFTNLGDFNWHENC